MRLSIFESLAAPTCRPVDVSWPDFVAYLSNPPEYPNKHAAPLLKLAAFGTQLSAKGSLRHDANVLSICGVEGDHDAGTVPPELAAAMLAAAGIQAVIYTSASHTGAAPRWRVLCPTSQEYVPAVRYELMGRINRALGGVLAGESFTLSQSFYFGRVVGVPYVCILVEGQPIDLVALEPLYPTTRNAASAGGDWSLSSEPVPEWRGPIDDDDLLRRALKSHSAASVFGNRASFADLWEGNVEALAKVWPGDPYNESEADAALVAHLAFWTGKHGERILSLMHRSALVRDKWDREDYLPRTIAEILARPGEVLQDKPIEPAGTPQASDEAPTMRAVEGQTFLSPDAQRTLFAGCVYVQDQHKALVPGGALLKPDQFRVMFGGYCMAMDAVNERTTRNAWEAFTESQVLRAPRAETICFMPDRPPAAIIKDAGKARVNTWWPAEVRRVAGDAGPFLRHLAKVLPDPRDQQILLSYMAACVQHKGVKFQWCPVLQGVEGNGKTLFSACVAEAVGQHYTHWIDAKSIVSEFNAYLAKTVFLAIEELYVQEHAAEVIEKLKTVIAGGSGTQIQQKGVDQVSMAIVCNLIATTNYRGAIRKTPDNARRFAVFYTAQQTYADMMRDGMGGDYFPDLWAWLRTDGFAVVTELLHTYQIPPELNPARIPRAPHTSTTDLVIAESRGSVEQQIAEVIAQGTPGFMGGWVSSCMLDRLISDTLRMGNRLSHSKRREMMQGMGYVLHPGLTDGRVNNPVMPDGKKPQLYILAGHPSAGIVGAAEIAKAYTAAQQIGAQA